MPLFISREGDAVFVDGVAPCVVKRRYSVVTIYGNSRVTMRGVQPCPDAYVYGYAGAAGLSVDILQTPAGLSLIDALEHYDRVCEHTMPLCRTYPEQPVNDG